MHCCFTLSHAPTILRSPAASIVHPAGEALIHFSIPYPYCIKPRENWMSEPSTVQTPPELARKPCQPVQGKSSKVTVTIQPTLKPTGRRVRLCLLTTFCQVWVCCVPSLFSVLPLCFDCLGVLSQPDKPTGASIISSLLFRRINDRAF